MKTVFSSQEIADQLTRDGGYWYGDNGDGVIHYSFSQSLGQFGSGAEFGLDSTQQQWVETALSQISSIIGLEFVEVGEPTNTTQDYPIDVLQFTSAANQGTYSQSWSYGDGGIAFSNIVFDSTWSSNQSGNLEYGSYGYTTMLHEILHSLGLEHPGEYDAGSGEQITYEDNAEFLQDTNRYTVMSYFDSYEDGSGAFFYDTENGTFVYPSTPMVYDILALSSGSFAGQFAGYAENSQTRSTDTVYGYNTANDLDPVFDFTVNTAPVVTLYDTGGEDTLDLSGDTVSTGAAVSYDENGIAERFFLQAREETLIDLREGEYSSTHGMSFNIGIAYGTVIENAIGTIFHDTIIGNDADNILDG